jgi:hypothetical protein
MSSEQLKGPSLLIQALASHARKAAEFVSGSNSAPGNPPVQSPPAPASNVANSSSTETERCECCGRPSLHPGQEGGQVVTEDEWYGLEEGDELDAERAKLDREIEELFGRIPEDVKEEFNDQGVSRSQILPGPLMARNERNKELTQRFKLRRDAVQFARKHKCLGSAADSPCGEFRVISRAQAKRLEAEWDFERAGFQVQNGIGVHEELIHLVPLVAGGCPTGKANLARKSALSEECLEADKRLRHAQEDAAERWSQGGF